jgi:hypothetical protein
MNPRGSETLVWPYKLRKGCDLGKMIAQRREIPLMVWFGVRVWLSLCFFCCNGSICASSRSWNVSFTLRVSQGLSWAQKVRTVMIAESSMVRFGAGSLVVPVALKIRPSRRKYFRLWQSGPSKALRALQHGDRVWLTTWITVTHPVFCGGNYK